MKRKVEVLGASAVLRNPKCTSARPKTVKNSFVRSYEHVDGNWPSLVYLTGKFSVGRFATLCCCHYALSMPQYNLVRVEDPHLSLSKSFVLRSHQIQPFILHLGNVVNSIQAFSSVLQSSYELLANDNQTRLFLTLPIEDNNGQIIKAVKCVDETLALFRQPTYYSNPKFHISFASHLIPADEGKVRESILTKVTTHPIVTIGPDFLQTHQAELHRDYLDADESDEEGGAWNNNLKCGMTVNAVPMQKDVVKETIPAVKTIVLSGLLDGYGSGSDNDDRVVGSDPQQSASSTELGQDATVPALSKVINFDAIECKIGNRLFRLDLSGANPSRFYEVLQGVK